MRRRRARENNRLNDEGEGCHFEQLLHDEAKMAEKKNDDDVVRPRMNALLSVNDKLPFCVSKKDENIQVETLQSRVGHRPPVGNRETGFKMVAIISLTSVSDRTV